jgi:hypothetical protein
VWGRLILHTSTKLLNFVVVDEKLCPLKYINQIVDISGKHVWTSGGGSNRKTLHSEGFHSFCYSLNKIIAVK